MCKPCTFEIWVGNEILVDNLSFADATEQIVIYQDFFGAQAFIVRRDSTTQLKQSCINPGFRKYFAEWIEYSEYLQSLDNLL